MTETDLDPAAGTDRPGPGRRPPRRRPPGRRLARPGRRGGPLGRRATAWRPARLHPEAVARLAPAAAGRRPAGLARPAAPRGRRGRRLGARPHPARLAAGPPGLAGPGDPGLPDARAGRASSTGSPARSAAYLLRREAVAFRCPPHPFVRDVLRLLPGPLVFRPMPADGPGRGPADSSATSGFRLVDRIDEPSRGRATRLTVVRVDRRRLVGRPRRVDRRGDLEPDGRDDPPLRLHGEHLPEPDGRGPLQGPARRTARLHGRRAGVARLTWSSRPGSRPSTGMPAAAHADRGRQGPGRLARRPREPEADARPRPPRRP